MDRLGSGHQGRPFIDLIEGVGGQDYGILVAVAVHHRLGDGVEGFAGAVDRQYMAFDVEALRSQLKALDQPVGDGPAQGGAASGGGVDGDAVHGLDHGLTQKRRYCMLGLADGDVEGVHPFRELYIAQQAGQTLEGVGVELLQSRIHW